MIAWLVQTLVASTILLGAVIVARSALRRRLSPRARYALWMLPALRLVLPGIPLLPARTVTLSIGSGAPLVLGTSALPSVMVAGWLAGAFCLFASQVLRYGRFVRDARADRVGPVERVDGVEIWHSGMVDGPVATGLWRREIFLPLDFAQRFSAEERRLALAHELMHHRRRDVLANCAASFVLSLHWFDPLAHYAIRLFRADQELACDADVIARAGDGCRLAYGRALLKAGQGAPTVGCALGDVALLKLRLRDLTLGSPRSRRWSGLVLLAGALLTASSAAVRAPATFRALPISDVVPPTALSVRQNAVRRFRPVAAVHTALRRPPDRREQAVLQGTPPPPPRSTETTHLDAAYLEQRRALGLARSRALFSSPAEAAAARGHPLIEPPPFG